MSCKTRTKDCLTSLVRRRPMFEKNEVMKTPLNRCLNVYHLTFYSLASMAGAGIYVLTGSLIGRVTGAAACISYIIAGISAIFTAVCYAEFATLIPKAGSVYVYTFLMLGELPAFIIGWTTVSDIIVSIASISKAFSGTINQLANNAILNWTEQNIGRLDKAASFFSPSLDFVALALIVLMVVVTATGAKSSMTLNLVITSLQILCLTIIAIGCYIYGSPESWSAKHGGFAPYGFHGIINGATIAVFAYSGFDSIANASEETCNPKKTIPRAMLASLLIISVLYFMASFGMAILVPREYIDLTSPFVSGFQRLHIVWLVYIAAIGTLLATGAAKISTMFVVPRMFYAIATDGLIFKFFAMVEKRTQVPLISLFIGGTIAGLLAFLINIQTLAEFTSLGILFSYFTIGIDIMVLRYIYDMPSNSIITDSPENENETKVDDAATEPDDAAVKFVDDGKDFWSQHVEIREKFECLAEKHPFLRTRKCFVLLFSLFIAISFAVAFVVDFILKVNSAFSIALTVVFFLVLLTSASTLFIYQPTINDDVYQSPWMPCAPLLTVFINSILIVRLPLITWFRFLIWTAVGLLIYFSYGRKHSIMAEGKYQPLDEDKNIKEDQKANYGTT